MPGSVPPGAEDVEVAVAVEAPWACLRMGEGCCRSGLPRETARLLRVGGEDGGCLASCNLQARALSSLMREASLTRRLKRGSVASVRKVSLRILE